LLNSVYFVIGTVIVSIVFSVLSSYALARYDFPGREFLYLAILGLMMVPGILTLLTRFLIVVKLGINNSFWGLWLPMAAGAQAFQIIVMRTFFASVPEDFFEAARLDGAGEVRMLWHIALPMAKPIVTTLLVLQAHGVWNEFLWPVMVMSDPHKLPAVIQILQFIDRHTSRFDPGVEKASYVLTGLPVLILFAFTSRAFIRGLTSGAIKM
jgi:multiple sugar transport system permease protein/raffinose/stachyose/melibiose transport system permease protein